MRTQRARPGFLGWRVALLAALIPLVGCAGDGQAGIPTMQADTRIAGAGLTAEITHRTGSVPPPYNHEWVVRLEPALSGTLTLSANYADGSSWSAPFTVTEAARDEFAATLDTLDLQDGVDEQEDGMVGGPTGAYAISTGDGRAFEGPLGVSPETRTLQDELDAAAQAVVPPDVWSSVFGDYEAWAASYEP